MTNAKVLVSDKLSDAGLEVLQAAKGVEVDYRPGLSEDELCDVIHEYDGLVIRSGTKVTANVVEAAENLKAVGRAGIGVDNVDIPSASRRGIVVMNTPTGNAVTTAEHALSLLTSLARKIPNAVASMRAGKWEKSKFQGREITGKTLGIVGLGNIGRIVADRAKGMRMKLIGVDPFLTKEKAASLGIDLVDLDELLDRADFITIHTPMTPDTKNLIDDAAFAKMRDGVLLVNAARGGIVDEEALVRAVQSGKVAGAALDVFSKEPLDPESPLLEEENIVCTPHLGASTKEAQERVAIEISEQMVDFLVRGTVRNAVNVPALPAETAQLLEPYLEVAHRIGGLLGQLDPVEVNELRVTCTGEAGELGVGPIARRALAAYLEHHLEEPVNPISAPFEAKDRGINLVEVKEPATTGYSSTIRVTITGEKGIHTATGVVGIDGQAHLVGLDGYVIDAVLAGNLLVMRNLDKPGVIGAVGTLLGKRKINVSRMQLGLDETTGQALALYNVDSDISDEALEDLRDLENVSLVLNVKL